MLKRANSSPDTPWLRASCPASEGWGPWDLASECHGWQPVDAPAAVAGETERWGSASPGAAAAAAAVDDKVFAGTCTAM